MRFSGIAKINAQSLKKREVKTQQSVWNAYDLEIIQSKTDAANPNALPIRVVQLTQPDSRNDRIFQRAAALLEKDPNANIGLKINAHCEVIDRYQYERPIAPDEADLTAVEAWKRTITTNYSLPDGSDIADLICATGELDIVVPTAFGARQMITSDTSTLTFRAKSGKSGQTLEDCNSFVASNMFSLINYKPTYQNLITFFDSKSVLGNAVRVLFDSIRTNKRVGIQFAAKMNKNLVGGAVKSSISLTDIYPTWMPKEDNEGVEDVSLGNETQVVAGIEGVGEDF
jgi:hypothetical protein